MAVASLPAMQAPSPGRDNPLTRSRAGLVGILFLAVMVVFCVGTLPWTLSSPKNGPQAGIPRYDIGNPHAGRLPPFWWPPDAQQAKRLRKLVAPDTLQAIANQHDTTVEAVISGQQATAAKQALQAAPHYWLGTDVLGRSLLIRSLTGGGISLGIGLAAAFISVFIGTLYGGLAGYLGGKTDALLMRIVDVLYGLPYILLVVLIAVASNALVDRHIASRGVELKDSTRLLIDVGTLLVAIGGVSWLTMARVIRGQVLSLKNQQFVEAARATGVSPVRLFTRHLLPNLLGPIIVYATLTVPQAILQESFLSFLGIGVKPPLPSWGNLAAEGLSELNTYRSNWWLLLFPCLFLGFSLLALNFVGEGLREAFDPKRTRR